MGAKVSNRSWPSVTINDYYVYDSTVGSGYYGSIEYILRAGESIYVTAAEFMKKLVVEKKQQEIRIIIDGEKLGEINHADFENNEEIVLEMNEEDGSFYVRFIAKKEKETLPIKGFWAFFCLRGGGGSSSAAVAL